VTLAGPATLSPPNNQLVDYALTASETPQEAGDGLPKGVTISYAVTTTDASGGDGGPTHDPDVLPQPTGTAASNGLSATVDFQLRAERSGSGAGRTYTIDWTASFDGGPHTCSSHDGSHQPFVVTVPNDSGQTP
jgi:hypothetical protein